MQNGNSEAFNDWMREVRWPWISDREISWYRSDERTISMANTRKRYSADFKAKVALDALKGELTLAQLAAKHRVHQTMIST